MTLGKLNVTNRQNVECGKRKIYNAVNLCLLLLFLLSLERGSPWENEYIESLNSKLRDELLNREIFTTLTEAKILIKEWRGVYNQFRTHSALGYRPPAPEAIMSDLMPVTLT